MDVDIKELHNCVIFSNYGWKNDAKKEMYKSVQTLQLCDFSARTHCVFIGKKK